MTAVRSLAICGLLGPASLLAQKPLDLTILHTNDLHAHVEPISIKGKSFAGYARQITLLKRLRAAEPNAITLSGGDTFQGTLFFNVYEGLADAAFLNLAGYQAATFGNHEFDRGTAPTKAFASALGFPIVAANVLSTDPKMAAAFAPSTILNVAGQKIGIVGATTPSTPNIASPGPTMTFADPYPAVQAEVDRLTKGGVNKIILLTHIGYAEDQALVRRLKGVDLVVGGHSHSPLGTPALPGWPASAGPYPTMVRGADGREVPIVQAWEWGKVVGRIRVRFDAAGNLVKVLSAAPIPVDETIPSDPEATRLAEAFAKPIAAVANEPVGSAAVALDKGPALGGLIADAMLATTRPAGAVVAFMNPGGVRAGLEPGRITYGAASSVLPFRNTLVLLDLTGAEIETALGQLAMFPSAGTSYRLADGMATEIVIAGAPLDRAKTYRVVTLNFLANGGDSVFAFRDAKGARTDTGKLDIEAFVEYLRANPALRPPGERLRR